jgi:NADPH:quinone reductase-like Zn-dependent oxidoreductase
MRAVVIDPRSPQRVGFRTVESPVPRATEALVSVQAISVNRGEVVYRVQGEAGTRLGWDLAGIVAQPAAEGPGPARGARVVGLLRSGAWAEQAAVPVNALAELDASVSFAQAAALPTAGLTALTAIGHGGSLIARTVLVTGASGGVGLIACRLASLAGARVVGQVRQSRYAPLVREAGADHVVVDDSVAAAEPSGPYHLIIEQLGGQALAEAMTQLAAGGNVRLGRGRDRGGRLRGPGGHGAHAAGPGSGPADPEPLPRTRTRASVGRAPAADPPGWCRETGSSSRRGGGLA